MNPITLLFILTGEIIMIYLCNGFSESMKRDPNMKQIPYSLSESEFVELIHNSKFRSCIGHESLAKCLTRICGKEILYNRASIQVNYDDVLILVSLKGRLPEHPSYIEYKGRLNYSFLRFEKQTPMDIQNSLNRIKKIKMEEF